MPGEDTDELLLELPCRVGQWPLHGEGRRACTVAPVAAAGRIVVGEGGRELELAVRPDLVVDLIGGPVGPAEVTEPVESRPALQLPWVGDRVPWALGHVIAAATGRGEQGRGEREGPGGRAPKASQGQGRRPRSSRRKL